MKLRDTNEPRQRTNCANGNHGRADGRTDVPDGRTDRRTDSPTFRTNWSHEILGEPKVDNGTLCGRETRGRRSASDEVDGEEREGESQERLREEGVRRDT